VVGFMEKLLRLILWVHSKLDNLEFPQATCRERKPEVSRFALPLSRFEAKFRGLLGGVSKVLVVGCLVRSQAACR
jgi:hypothetical protein